MKKKAVSIATVFNIMDVGEGINISGWMEWNRRSSTQIRLPDFFNGRKIALFKKLCCGKWIFKLNFHFFSFSFFNSGMPTYSNNILGTEWERKAKKKKKQKNQTKQEQQQTYYKLLYYWSESSTQVQDSWKLTGS